MWGWEGGIGVGKRKIQRYLDIYLSTDILSILPLLFKIKNFIFLHDNLLILNRQVKGLCTPQGSCRVLGNDYVFQGGCGEVSRWVTLLAVYQSLYLNFLIKDGGLCEYQRMFLALWLYFIIKKSLDTAPWEVTVGQGMNIYIFPKRFCE